MSDAYSLPSVGSEGSGPLRFISNGNLVGLRLNGREPFREISARSGFFVVKFDGSQLREVSLPHVTVVSEHGLRVVAENRFPRFEFSVSVTERKLRMILTRVEGMPAERDVSLGFRAGLAVRTAVLAIGASVITKPAEQSAHVYWTGLRSAPMRFDLRGFQLAPERLP